MDDDILDLLEKEVDELQQEKAQTAQPQSQTQGTANATAPNADDTPQGKEILPQESNTLAHPSLPVGLPGHAPALPGFSPATATQASANGYPPPAAGRGRGIGRGQVTPGFAPRSTAPAAQPMVSAAPVLVQPPVSTANGQQAQANEERNTVHAIPPPPPRGAAGQKRSFSSTTNSYNSGGSGAAASSVYGSAQDSSAAALARQAEDAYDGGKKRYLMKKAGKVWEDKTLEEWPEDDFRLFVGNLGNEVDNDMLSRAFKHYPSFQRSKVIRDPRIKKNRGYGFVSFSDVKDYSKALMEMQGKYIGNRPCKIQRSSWTDRQKKQRR